jgi:biopolymer transport protein ExbD
MWLKLASMIDIQRRPRRTRGIPLTSLIDVMFLLMKFFVLTTSYVNIEALTLGVLNDDASNAKMASTAQPATQELVLLGSGAAFLNNQLVYFSDIESRLQVLLLKNPASPVIVSCDEGVKVQMMVDVLDMIQRAGGKEVKLSRWKKA